MQKYLLKKFSEGLDVILNPDDKKNTVSYVQGRGELGFKSEVEILSEKLQAEWKENEETNKYVRELSKIAAALDARGESLQNDVESLVKILGEACTAVAKKNDWNERRIEDLEKELAEAGAKIEELQKHAELRRRKHLTA